MDKNRIEEAVNKEVAKLDAATDSVLQQAQRSRFTGVGMLGVILAVILVVLWLIIR